MSEDLPMLPGLGVRERTSFHKSQVFSRRNGALYLDHEKPGIGGQPLLGQTRAVNQRTAAAVLSQTRALGDTGSVPAWIALDRHVLRFTGYSLEAVVESPVEAYRVRQCTLLYYLEDDTIQLGEPRQENSGMPQGTLLKRQRVPKDGKLDSAEFVTLLDLNVGVEVNVYGRVIRLVDCDPFTRSFLNKLGVEVGEPEEMPVDAFAAKLAASKRRGRQSGEPKSTGPRLQLRQFLERDRQVLRFSATWDDRESVYGDLRKLVILYYLSDDTVMVNEQHDSNSGYDPFPVFLRRQRMQKADGSGASAFFTPVDFDVGATVTFYNRELFVYDADDFTRDFYRKELGRELRPAVDVSEPKKAPPKQRIPPHNGIGTEEDTLASMRSLQPKPPRKDHVQLMENDGKVMRFSAKLVTDRPDDLERRFVISYYLADNTMGIFEPPIRNTGVAGGPFLKRNKTKNAATGEYFRPTDLYMGAVVEVNRRSFLLLEADEYTLKHMEQEWQKFPMANFGAVSARIAEQLASNAEAAASLRKLLGGKSTLSESEFYEWAGASNLDVALQEWVTVARNVDAQRHGHLPADALRAALHLA